MAHLRITTILSLIVVLMATSVGASTLQDVLKEKICKLLRRKQAFSKGVQRNEKVTIRLMPDAPKLDAWKVTRILDKERGGVQIIIEEPGRRVLRFGQTPRKLREIVDEFYGTRLNIEEMRGKRVLDAGTGRGTFVEELRDQGIEAYGLDISLDESKKGLPYFFERPMESTGLPDASVDEIYSTYTHFQYHRNDIEGTAAILREFSRILPVGGVIKISPCDTPSIAKAIVLVPGLRITHSDFRPNFRLGNIVEITKFSP